MVDSGRDPFRTAPQRWFWVRAEIAPRTGGDTWGNPGGIPCGYPRGVILAGEGSPGGGGSPGGMDLQEGGALQGGILRNFSMRCI